ncbi:MAG: hypothetical protein V2A76_06505 [Planctomycetota bacterium]
MSDNAPGPGRPPTGPGEKEPGRSGGATWERFLEQLRSRGPSWRRYDKQGELARGGMGVIYRVFDRDVRRTLAMKVVLGQEERGTTCRRFLAGSRTRWTRTGIRPAPCRPCSGSARRWRSLTRRAWCTAI